MLSKVEVRTTLGALLTFPLEDASGGFAVEEIEGLDPVKATLVSSSFAGLDGLQYQSARREARNLKLRVALEPDYVTESVRDLRKRLYGFFMPKSFVSFRFYLLDGLVVDIAGRVESFDSPQFVKDPVANISVMCFDPDFFEPTPIVEHGLTVADSTNSTITYNGTVETGVKFKLFVDRDLSTFTIYHQPPSDALRMLDFSSPLVAGDVLTISTVPGSKYATLTRASSDSSILWGISPQSSWIELMPGDNLLRVYAEGLPVAYTIEYTNKYGGL